MESPAITPISPGSSCAFFESYGLDASLYDPLSPTSPLTPTSESMHREICIRKCNSISAILKENWLDLIFKVNFPNLISQEKLVHAYSLQQLNHILEQGDLLPEEREEIKRIRCKARNNKAAKSLRQKYKEQDKTLADDVTVLLQHKEALKREREKIMQEISELKAVGAHNY